MKVAITGNIGSGKSMVARYLAEITGAEHCDTDIVCRDLLEKGQPGWLRVKQKWGKRFIGVDGSLDREKLRAAVFESELIRHELENILHPYVRDYVSQLMQHCEKEGKLVIVEVPLLFEVGWQNDFDYIVTVTADEDDVVERVVLRDRVSAEQVEKVLNIQMDISEKAQCSDFVINNSGTIEQSFVQVDLLKADILQKWGLA